MAVRTVRYNYMHKVKYYKQNEEAHEQFMNEERGLN